MLIGGHTVLAQDGYRLGERDRTPGPAAGTLQDFLYCRGGGLFDQPLAQVLLYSNDWLAVAARRRSTACVSTGTSLTCTLGMAPY